MTRLTGDGSEGAGVDRCTPLRFSGTLRGIPEATREPETRNTPRARARKGGIAAIAVLSWTLLRIIQLDSALWTVELPTPSFAAIARTAVPRGPQAPHTGKIAGTEGRWAPQALTAPPGRGS